MIVLLPRLVIPLRRNYTTLRVHYLSRRIDERGDAHNRQERPTGTGGRPLRGWARICTTIYATMIKVTTTYCKSAPATVSSSEVISSATPLPKPQASCGTGLRMYTPRNTEPIRLANRHRALADIGACHKELRDSSCGHRQAKQDEILRVPVAGYGGGEWIAARIDPRHQEQVNQRPYHRSDQQHHLSLASGGPAILADHGGLESPATKMERWVIWIGPRILAETQLVPEQDHMGQGGKGNHVEQRGSSSVQPVCMAGCGSQSY